MGQDRNRPTLVQSFAIISSASPVVYIACGPFSSYAINANGRVFSWGLNENYELGLGQGMSRTSPQLIRFFDDNNISIKRIIPGGFHVLAVSDEVSLHFTRRLHYMNLPLKGFISSLFSFKMSPMACFYSILASGTFLPDFVQVFFFSFFFFTFSLSLAGKPLCLGLERVWPNSNRLQHQRSIR